MKKLFSVFKKGLQKTAVSVTRTFTGIFTNIQKWDESTYEELEASLLSADFGVKVTMRLLDDIRDRYDRGQIQTSADILAVTREDICNTLQKNIRPIKFASDGPTIILMVGVNGSGKTTSSGKLAYLWKQEGKKVMLAACDTFRAAAVEQLNLWGERVGCHVVSAKSGADPSAVAFDAVKSAVAREADILLIDTAGRQHTSKGLMEELSKMCRSIDKAYPGAPQEVWLTVDASIGTNALIQAREFTSTAKVSGLIITKLDGTGKGGMAVAIQEEFSLPVFFVGLGESPDDLQPFDPEYYTDALLGLEEK
jgi:fused signal recognition particle receptor